MDSPLIIALDLEPNEVLKFVKKIDPSDCQLKIGNQLFTSQGPDIVKRLQDNGFKVFLDIKYNDITNYLSNERSFSRDRVNSSLNRLKKNLEKKSQTLEQWF